MSFLADLGSSIARIPVPAKVQRVFLETSKEGPASIYLPEGSVIVGRSAAAAKRGGFLEFQERFPEEVAGAIIWLWGVKGMGKFFDKFIAPRFFRNTEHLSTDTAWSFGKPKIKDVELIAQERMARNAGEISRLITKKFSKWVFSVGLAIGFAAYLIPKANQIKTNWILKHYYNKPANNPAPQGQPVTPQAAPGPNAGQGAPRFTGPAPAGLPSAQTSYNTPANPSMVNNQMIPGFAGLPGTGKQSGHPKFEGDLPPASTALASNPTLAQNGQNVVSTTPGMAAPASNPTLPGGMTPPTLTGLNPAPSVTPGAPRAPQFSGLPVGSLIQGLGHLVDQTSYGSILVVDAGITGGRGWVASKRSVFETAEVVFRDAVSLYFYILFAPHMMKMLASAIDPALKTSIQLEPKVAEEVNRLISRQLANRVTDMAKSQPELAKAFFEKCEVPKALIQEVISGASHDGLLLPEGWLKGAMRTAQLSANNGQAFLPLLEKEAGAYFSNAQQGTKLAGDVGEFLSSRLNKPGQLTTENVHQLLNAINLGQGPFAGLQPLERKNLGIAVKQAFRHSVGVPMELTEAAIRKMPQLKETFKALPADEQLALIERIQRMAGIDGLDQANTMIQRSMNLLRGNLTEAAAGQLEAGEAMAGWLDKAVTSHLTLDELLKDEVENLRDTLQGSKLPDEVKALLGEFEQTTPESLKQLESALAGLTDRKAKKLLSSVQELNKLLSAATPEEGKLAGKSLATLAQRNIARSFNTLLDGVKADIAPEAKAVLEAYRKPTEELLSGKSGRLFSMLVSDAELEPKLKEMLAGGLQHDSALVRKAMGIMGQFEADSKRYLSPKKLETTTGAIEKYTDALLAKLDAAEVKAADGTLKVLDSKGLMETFYKLNRNTHYGARALSLAGTMLCLGWLVPKMQYALTKKLTGKNVNPGIASAENANGMGGEGASEPGKASGAQTQAQVPAIYSGPGLNRTGFQAFKRA